MTFDAEQLEKLRTIAKRHGYELTTSQLVGAGNVKGMLEAVAAGELAVVRLVDANGHN